MTWGPPGRVEQGWGENGLYPFLEPWAPIQSMPSASGSSSVIQAGKGRKISYLETQLKRQAQSFHLCWTEKYTVYLLPISGPRDLVYMHVPLCWPKVISAFLGLRHRENPLYSVHQNQRISELKWSLEIVCHLPCMLRENVCFLHPRVLFSTLDLCMLCPTSC